MLTLFMLFMPIRSRRQAKSIISIIGIGIAMKLNTIIQKARQARHPSPEMVKPFPQAWLEQLTYEELERLAIMTVDGENNDTEALQALNFPQLLPELNLLRGNTSDRHGSFQSKTRPHTMGRNTKNTD